MKSVDVHSSVLLAIINKEIHLGAWQSTIHQCSILDVNQLSSAKKGWGLEINHKLGLPIGNSVNDFIDPALCSVSYASFDDAITMISSLGKATLLCKIDLSSAFRLLPIHPSDFCLLGMCIQGKFYIDKCMPFGCSIACSTFEKFSSFLHWALAKNSNNPNIIHYLDDFLFAGSSNTSHCAQLAASFQTLCNQFVYLLTQTKLRAPLLI